MGRTITPTHTHKLSPAEKHKKQDHNLYLHADPTKATDPTVKGAQHRIRHNNNTGRWLSKFWPMWCVFVLSVGVEWVLKWNGIHVGNGIYIHHDTQPNPLPTTPTHNRDPKHPDAFVIGSLEQPRRIEVRSVAPFSNVSRHHLPACAHPPQKPTTTPQQVYSAAAGFQIASVRSDYMNSVQSICVFHPTRNVLVGANSSGRTHVFRGP